MGNTEHWIFIVCIWFCVCILWTALYSGGCNQLTMNGGHICTLHRGSPYRSQATELTRMWPWWNNTWSLARTATHKLVPPPAHAATNLIPKPLHLAWEWGWYQSRSMIMMGQLYWPTFADVSARAILRQAATLDLPTPVCMHAGRICS